MSLLLAALRWFGWKAGAFALCALLALSWAGIQTLRVQTAKRSLALSRASVAVLEAQRDAAAELARDYEARAERAVADLAASEKARKAAEKARAKKWAGIRESERAWSEVPVPDSVVEALR